MSLKAGFLENFPVHISGRLEKFQMREATPTPGIKAGIKSFSIPHRRGYLFTPGDLWASGPGVNLLDNLGSPLERCWLP